MLLVVSIYAFLITIGLLIVSSPKQIFFSFTLKGIPLSSDIDSSVTLKTLLSFMLHVCNIVYQILKPHISFVFDSIAYRWKK